MVNIGVVTFVNPAALDAVDNQSTASLNRNGTWTFNTYSAKETLSKRRALSFLNNRRNFLRLGNGFLNWLLKWGSDWFTLAPTRKPIAIPTLSLNSKLSFNHRYLARVWRIWVFGICSFEGFGRSEPASFWNTGCFGIDPPLLDVERKAWLFSTQLCCQQKKTIRKQHLWKYKRSWI